MGDSGIGGLGDYERIMKGNCGILEFGLNNNYKKECNVKYIEQNCFNYFLSVQGINSKHFSKVGGKPRLSKNKSPKLLYTIYPILACLEVLITYGKPVKSQIGQLSNFSESKNHAIF